MKDPERNKLARTDGFWDMEGLIPQRRKSRPFSSDTDTVEVPLSGTAPREKGEAIPKREESERLRLAREALRQVEQKQKRKAAVAEGQTYDEAVLAALSEATVPPAAETPRSETYAPADNPLLQSVTISPWPTQYSFYESFRRNALRYADKTAEPCEPVPFFSYTPQYVQMSKEALRFYFYWRSEVKAGRYPPVDYAYLLLFLYEIINLPDRIPPTEGVVLMGRLWAAYRETYPKLDRNLAEWLCDYCLIHHLTPPARLYEAFLPAILSCASLKEFYVGYDGASPSPYASALFSYCSSYRWQTSKFLTPENRPLFETHVRGAFLHAWAKAEREHQTVFAPVGQQAMVHATLVRDAFRGALCCYGTKRRIEVQYLACSRSVELRYTVTDTVKYAENQIRGLLGIRSRFHTPNLPAPLRQAVDEYFAPYKKAVKKETAPPPPPAYDALYEPLSDTLSPEDAKAIEKQAWATTELLVEAEEETPPERTPPTEPAAPLPPSPATAPPTAPSGAASAGVPLPSYLTEALTLCLDGDTTGFFELAHRHHLLPDALCEAVNDALYDVIGDIAIEEDGAGGYRAVPDYREEITAWMKR